MFTWSVVFGQTADKFYEQFWPGLAATMIGGILLALLFFFCRERLWSIPVLAGVWECEYTVESTEHGPFRGMKIFYHVVLIQAGKELKGTGEKDREISILNGEMSYSGRGRVNIKVGGIVDQRIFGHDKVRIFWDEVGTRRDSSAYFDLSLSGEKDTGDYVGRFYTTAGKCAGTCKWTRRTT